MFVWSAIGVAFLNYNILELQNNLELQLQYLVFIVL